jgi:UDP-2,4-diacetamido-2,4,6-trideoxy-beta-L-altropyranose hydrolase
MRAFFRCNAGQEVGFGHLRRCLALAGELESQGGQVAFQGDFSSEAECLIDRKRYVRLGPKDIGVFDVGLMDWMFDAQDMDRYDLALIEEFASHCRRSVLLTSARSIPEELPIDVVVGHVVEPPADSNYKCMHGLHFAPVPPDWEFWRNENQVVAESIQRILVAFGAWKDEVALFKTLRGLRTAEFSGEVDVLLAPPHRDSKKALSAVVGSSFTICFHEEVQNVAELLVAVDLAIGGYGNLTYEALAMGTPYLCVGLKEFQVRYAQFLEEKGLLLCAGGADTLMEDEIGRLLAEFTPKCRSQFKHEGMRAVDLHGLRRIVDVLFDEARPTGRITKSVDSPLTMGS